MIAMNDMVKSKWNNMEDHGDEWVNFFHTKDDRIVKMITST